jgi:hypothetical protein
MRISPKLTALSLAAVVAIGLSAPLHAGATKKQTVPSQINVTQLGPNGAVGMVSSPRPACVAHRHVTLYKEETILGAPAGRAIADTTTSADGTWSFQNLLYSDQYYAEVTGGGTRRISCASSASPPQDF